MISLRNFARTAGAIAGLSALGMANAAPTVESLSGTVRVNQGSGYSTVRGSSTVKAGDSVMADLRGSGKITYDDGCVVEVKPGAVVTIGDTSPCTRQAALPIKPGTGLLVAAGAAAVGTGIALGVGSGGGGGTGGLIPFIAPKPASP